MSKFTLDQQTYNQLKEIHHKSTSQQARKRSHALLLRSDGFKMTDVARICNTTERTAYVWFSEWKKRGFESLPTKKKVWKKHLISKEMEPQIFEWIEEYPNQPKVIWQTIMDTFKIKLSYKTVTRFIKKTIICGNGLDGRVKKNETK